jgi:hypothetical protein
MLREHATGPGYAAQGFLPTPQKGLFQRLYAWHSPGSDMERQGWNGRKHLILFTFTHPVPTCLTQPLLRVLPK